MDTVTGELIAVKQLPEIEERLRTVKESIDRRVSYAKAMVCTAETIQAVKEERAKLRQEFGILEDQRKDAKRAVLEPYEQFEAVYKACVSDAFQSADAAMKKKIDDVESEIKRTCEEGLRDYFDELCAVYHLEWLTYDRAGIKVDMASAKAKTPGKLRKQLAAFVRGVSESVNRISRMDNPAEIMVEFKETLDEAEALYAVSERRRRMAVQRAAQEARRAEREREAEMVRRVEALGAPVAAEAPEPAVECTFTVRAAKSQLRRLKEFLNREGIRYE